MSVSLTILFSAACVKLVSQSRTYTTPSKIRRKAVCLDECVTSVQVQEHCILLPSTLFSTPTLVGHLIHVNRYSCSSFPCTVYVHRPLVFHQWSVSRHFTTVNSLNSAATLGCLKFPGTLLYLIYSYLRHRLSTTRMVVSLLC